MASLINRLTRKIKKNRSKKDADVDKQRRRNLR